MRLILHGNNRAAVEITEWLRQRGDTIVGLVVHPPEKRICGEALVTAAGVSPEHIFDGSRLNEQSVQDQISALHPTHGLSVYFGYILKPEYVALFPNGCVNLHPAFLPFNRGAYPNVWSLIDDTPAGVTLHVIHDGIDTGDILAQREVIKKPTDTGLTLYQRLESETIKLFREKWPEIVAGRLQPIPQSGEGTTHRVGDVAHVDEIDLDRSYKASDLINLLRARTFPPHKGSYFRAGNRRIYLKLDLMEESSDVQ